MTLSVATAAAPRHVLLNSSPCRFSRWRRSSRQWRSRCSQAMGQEDCFTGLWTLTTSATTKHEISNRSHCTKLDLFLWAMLWVPRPRVSHTRPPFAPRSVGAQPPSCAFATKHRASPSSSAKCAVPPFMLRVGMGIATRAKLQNVTALTGTPMTLPSSAPFHLRLGGRVPLAPCTLRLCCNRNLVPVTGNTSIA